MSTPKSNVGLSIPPKNAWKGQENVNESINTLFGQETVNTTFIKSQVIMLNIHYPDVDQDNCGCDFCRNWAAWIWFLLRNSNKQTLDL